MQDKQYLLGMTLSELRDVVISLKMPQFVAKQIADWLYLKRVKSIDEMRNISQKNRDLLSNPYEVGRRDPIDVKTSIDGTQKMLFFVSDNKYVESVTIPEADRLTICVSSQVGCKMSCQFCMTGRQGFGGHLTANDIINQIYSVPNSEKITNLVYMGMGEPLDNYPTVLKSIEIITSEYGLGWSPKRITLSTIGVVPALTRFLDDCSCHLAVSLHSPTAQQRKSLMPIEKASPMSDVIALLKEHDWSKQRRLSFEYIVFDGLNDSIDDARKLISMIREIDCRVNLIRYHAIPDSLLRTSSNEKMIQFRDFLNSKGVVCTIRASRGEDVFAACGMLSTAKNKKDS